MFYTSLTPGADTIDSLVTSPTSRLYVNFKNWQRNVKGLCEKIGILLSRDGRLNAKCYLLPCVLGSNPNDGLGVFVKIYKEAQHEYNIIRRAPPLPILVTSRCFPEPRLLNGDCLILPLVLSTSMLRKVLRARRRLFRAIDLDDAYKTHIRYAKRTYPSLFARHVPVRSSTVQRLLYHIYLRYYLLFTKKFLHADSAANVMTEDGRSLVFRLFGEFPRGNCRYYLQIGPDIVLEISGSLLTLVDYDAASIAKMGLLNSKSYDHQRYCTLSDAFDIYNLYSEEMGKLEDVLRDDIMAICKTATSLMSQGQLEEAYRHIVKLYPLKINTEQSKVYKITHPDSV